jgi:RHS repeat-associated protein
VDDSGVGQSEFGYGDAFGIPYQVAANGTRATAGAGFFLNGQQWDGSGVWNSGEGLYFNRARYYQPGLGRFIGVDPLFGRDYEPTTLHRYLYTGTDPVNGVDPSGEEFTLTGQMAVGAITGGLASAASDYALTGKVHIQNVLTGVILGGMLPVAGTQAYIAASMKWGTTYWFSLATKALPYIGSTIAISSGFSLAVDVLGNPSADESQKITAVGLVILSIFTVPQISSKVGALINQIPGVNSLKNALLPMLEKQGLWRDTGPPYRDLTGHRKDHIVNNHMSGKSTKTDFPSSWTRDEVMDAISFIWSDKSSLRGFGKWVSPYRVGIYRGVVIRVDGYPLFSPDGSVHRYAGNISTAYPINTTNNP